MIKYLVLAVIAIVIVVLGYIALKTEKRPQTVNKQTVERSAETKESAKPQEESAIAAENTQASTKTDSPEVANKEVDYTDDEDDDEISPEEREDDKAPVVSREKLIGGADVEWTEPKEKSPDNKFGLPPQ